MLRKLEKLKGKGALELADRGLQAGNVLAERLGVSPQLRLPDDDELFRKFAVGSSTALREYLRQRNTNNFYPSFADPVATADVVRERFPAEAKAAIEKADNICRGLFDLLGYKELFFNAVTPDWHYDAVARRATPLDHWSRIDIENIDIDIKVVWELNRHQYFAALGQAYLLTGDEKYPETYASHLGSWIDANPPKFGVNWISSLEIAFRSVSWIWAFHFFRGSVHLSPELLTLSLKHLWLNGRHLETFLSTYSSPNTHLTGEALGLYFLGTFLPELPEGERWKDLGLRILLEAIDTQVADDGVYCEQSTHYHRYTTDFFVNLLIFERDSPDPHSSEKLRSTVNRLMDFVLYTIQPDGQTPLIGDDDGGRLYFLDRRPITDFRPAAALGAVILDRADLKFAADDAGVELLWLLGPEGLAKFDSIVPAAPDRTAKPFRSGGFFVMRGGWFPESDYMMIDCGRHGFLNGGHAHADALGFVLSLDGCPLFVDSGTYKYASDLPSRQRFRSTAAHNCVTVDGESSSIPGGPWSWQSVADSELVEWSESSAGFRFRGRHNGFHRFNIEYEREMDLEPARSVSITDSFKTDGNRRIEINFILAPGVIAKIAKGFVSLSQMIKGKYHAFDLRAETSCNGETAKGIWRLEPWSISYCYGSTVPSHRLIYSVEAAGQIEVKSVISRALNGI